MDETVKEERFLHNEDEHAGMVVVKDAQKKVMLASNRFLRMMQWLYSIVFILVIMTPLLLFLIRGSTEQPLDNEKEALRPALTAQGYLSGEFQSGFEAWFSTHYPLRGRVVRTYREARMGVESLPVNPASILASVRPQSSMIVLSDDMLLQPSMYASSSNSMYSVLNYAQRSEIPVEPVGFQGGNTIVVGKSGFLYSTPYLEEYYGFSGMYRDTSDESLQRIVNMLSYIQNRLEERGIAFLYFFTPSKASQYPEYIPQWYIDQNQMPENYIRPYTRLINMLKASDVHYLDSAALYEEVGLMCTFTKTGIHWNKLAAFETMKGILRSYEEQTGKTVRRLTADTIRMSTVPVGTDQDIYSILYSGIDSTGIVDNAYYLPNITVENPEAEPINVLLHGGSFCWDLKGFFQENGVSNIFRQFYYCDLQENDIINDPFGDAGYMAWEELLKDIDYVLFECNEEQMRGGFPAEDSIAASKGHPGMGGNVIYMSLYTYLHETESGEE